MDGLTESVELFELRHRLRKKMARFEAAQESQKPYPELLRLYKELKDIQLKITQEHSKVAY